MIKQALHIIHNMGMRYTLYRISHEIEKRTGVLKKKHPQNPPFKQFVSLDEWKNNLPNFAISERELINFEKVGNSELKQKTEKILKGESCFFSSEWKSLGLKYDWITNPDSDFRYDITKHWSEIDDFSLEMGDIKYVWEKSRFSYLLTIIRNDYHNQEDHAEFVFAEIENWIEANPVNQGPNWRCSQEISLRIFNWCFALWFYKASQSLTEERWNKIQHIIYWSLHHVYHHINFSRIAVRNNHAITETLFLALSNMLFPFIPETKKWAKEGRKWFEEEIAYQIYEDGTFLQFSMNYHRVVIQLLSLGISIAKKNKQPFSDNVYEKAYKSIFFLYQCMQDENGLLPNYGANDGAWFFPLSDTDYRDFRPQLNSLHKLLTGDYLFNDSILKEESFWLDAHNILVTNAYPLIKKEYGKLAFKDGGYYIIREKESFTFIKCGKYKDRPSHADNLHIDIWKSEINLLCDGGSYKYNTSDSEMKYFNGTESHNTIMLNNYDQMLKGSRFIWLHWSQAEKAAFNESADAFDFTGTVACFSHINRNIKHIRHLRKLKEKDEWIIFDTIENKPRDLFIRQLWHTTNKTVEFSSNSKDKVIKKNYQSLYYGEKGEIAQVEFLTQKNTIETKITLQKT